ncbi:MAG: hypothetical protein U1E35_06160 [Rhodospirillales bacterium]
MVKAITRTAGIDTGKDRLDVAVHGGGDPFSVNNTQAGWQSLADRLSHEGVERVGIEASGSYDAASPGTCRRPASPSSCCSRCRSAPSPASTCAAPRTTASMPS